MPLPPDMTVRPAIAAVAFMALPVAGATELAAAAGKLERCLECVRNMPGGEDVSRVVSDRYPQRTQAIIALGHAVIQQADPGACMPARDDVSVYASTRLELYASSGVHLMERTPGTDQPQGQRAAVGVIEVLALYGPGSGRQAQVSEALESIRAACVEHEVLGAQPAGQAGSVKR